MKNNSKMSVGDIFIAFNQIWIYLLFSRIFRYYFRASKKRPASIKNLKRGSLIVANHQSILDPFNITAHLPLRSFLSTIPIRYPMDHDEYLKHPLLVCFGTYDIGKNKKERMLGLFRTRQYLLDGKTIMLFPEGKICTSENKGMEDFQEGITFLTDVACNSLFVRMDGFHRSDWLKIWQKNRMMAFSEIQEFNGERKNIQVIRDCMESLSV